MKKKKVILLTNIIAPYRVPLYNVISQDKNIDFLVYFFAEREKFRSWEIDDKEIKFNYEILKGYQLSFFGSDLFTYHFNPSIIYKLIKQKPDIIIGMYSSFADHMGWLYSKFRRKTKNIIWLSNTVFERSLKRKIFTFVKKIIIKTSDAFIAYGTKAKEYGIELGAHEESIFYAFNSIDNDKYFKIKQNLNKEDIRKKYKLTNNIIICFCGRLVPLKGVDYLIEAYQILQEKHRDISLAIIGDGPLLNELKSKCINEKIEGVLFFGNRSTEEICEILYASSIFVLPSWREVWGLVLNEAMIFELPIISTDKVGGSYDLIKNGLNGFIVESKSSVAIAEKINIIISNKGLITKMGKESLKLIKHINIENEAMGIINSINYIK
ncbi:MAG: glycosyltransferase [Spirochaetota bacterium]|nr:glycosyltransferase [Spirochaetota bacterium]